MGVSRLLADVALPWLIAGSIVSVSLVVLLIWGVSQMLRRHRRMRLLQAEAYALSPTAFEECVALVLADLGWEQVRLSGGSGDRGVDIHAIYDGQRYIVQCKRYKNQVTPAMVRELIGTLHIQQADRALGNDMEGRG